MLLRFLKPRVVPPPALPRDLTHPVAGRVLPLRVVENARARRLTLRIDAKLNGLRVTVPMGTSERVLFGFLDRHEAWIEARLDTIPDRPMLRPGARLPIRGVPHLIVHEPGRRGTAELGEVEGKPALIVHGDRAHLPRRIADFLKREARREIAPLVARHAEAVGRKAKAVRYKDTSSRWGSCTADGTLSFSWRIMMAPPAVIDYLVAHEVAHLKEMNHGPKFWALCRTLCPATDRCKAWLKKNGGALQAIGFG